MKLYESGEDYLEAVLMLQKKMVWYALLTLPGTWRCQSPACAMQWLPCGTAAFSLWTKITFSI